ncbi:MAG TPA: 3-deoxy-8-phosphooctulonate synthase [Polyangiaceae bacterium]|nr:3-deoxy-8-phosphooctulonate synthase [Polyangiaceae bacterium]
MDLLGNLVGNDRPLFLIAGPCVVEPGTLVGEVAHALKEMCARAGVFFIFKASYDKANRSSSRSFRGLGIGEGLRILDDVKRTLGVPVLTDVHERTPVAEVAAVVDVLQTPAFLARQTDFVQDVARAGKPLNLKKAQFMAPADMINVVEKCREVGNDQVMVCERGVSFGYNNLVADMRSLAILRRTGCPVVFDATHSVQQPGGLGTASGGQREMVPVLARAAVAAGVAGVFMETHPNPDGAPSDGPNMWPLSRMEELLKTLVELDAIVKRQPYAEASLL